MVYLLGVLLVFLVSFMLSNLGCLEAFDYLKGILGPNL